MNILELKFCLKFIHSFDNFSKKYLTESFLMCSLVCLGFLKRL